MSTRLYRRLLQDTGPFCGYCRTAAHIIGQPLTIEHITPVAKGGTSHTANLWLSCRRCNQYKCIQTEALDPDSNISVALFNPRTQRWTEHFAWSSDGSQIIGLTASGRATVIALRLNNDEIVSARRLWVSVGWHPPRD